MGGGGIECGTVKGCTRRGIKSEVGKKKGQTNVKKQNKIVRAKQNKIEQPHIPIFEDNMAQITERRG